MRKSATVSSKSTTFGRVRLNGVSGSSRVNGRQRADNLLPQEPMKSIVFNLDSVTAYCKTNKPVRDTDWRRTLLAAVRVRRKNLRMVVEFDRFATQIDAGADRMRGVPSIRGVGLDTVDQARVHQPRRDTVEDEIASGIGIKIQAIVAAEEGGPVIKLGAGSSTTTPVVSICRTTCACKALRPPPLQPARHRRRVATLVDQSIIYALVLGRHHHGREALLEYLAAALPRQFSDLGDRPHEVVYSRRYQARNARAQHLRHRATGPRDHRSTTRQRLDHRQPEWLGPVHREEHRQRAAKEILLLGVVNFTEKFDPGGGEQRLDYRIKVVAIDPIDLGRNLEWNPGAPCNFDRKVRSLLGCDTAQEGEVGAGAGVEAQKILRQAVINRSEPVHERERAALLVTDRDQRKVGVRPVERHEGLEIESAVHG